MDERPPQPPEGVLIEKARERSDLSQRRAAIRAGVSYGRWRQITGGYQSASAGSYVPVSAPARTLAKMAAAVAVTADELAAAGREDAAAILRAEPGILDVPKDAAVAEAVGAIKRIPGLTTEERELADAFAKMITARRRRDNGGEPGVVNGA